ncbi:MAG TPA: enoyl-CoA hydratase/isomerase family protein [Terriglobales bacterium]|nr:enoyl-CoA hydratase/isomerase family protein [Terriglobales bacterium]
MIDIIDHGTVRELRLNRPPVNALSPDLIPAITRSVDQAAKQGARALVLSGSPGRFCGGLDLPLLMTLDRNAISALWRDFYSMMCVLAACPIPLAAAITGHAPAGGTVLTLFADHRIAPEGDWKLGLNEVQVGLALPPVIFLALRRIVGSRQAERLAVSGLLISPQESLRIGLVDEIVPPDQVIDRAIAWCQGTIALPDGAMISTRQQARADLVKLFEHSFANELEDVSEMWWDDETQAVLRAVAAKLGKKS